MKKVKKAIAELSIKTNTNLKGVYLSGLGNIIEGTPVDEGRTRNNWFLSVGIPSSQTSTIGNQAKNISLTISGDKASASGVQDIKLPQNVLGKIIYLTNNLPNINVLEYGGYPDPVEQGSWVDGKFQKLSEGGYSKQLIPLLNPNGWVRNTLGNMQTKIKAL